MPTIGRRTPVDGTGRVSSGVCARPGGSSAAPPRARPAWSIRRRGNDEGDIMAVRSAAQAQYLAQWARSAAPGSTGGNLHRAPSEIEQLGVPAPEGGVGNPAAPGAGIVGHVLGA